MVTKEQIEETRQRVLKSMEILVEIGGIALHGMAAPGGGAQGWAGLDEMLRDTLVTPWNTEDLREGVFQGILRLAGQTWQALSNIECDLLGYLENPPKVVALKGEGQKIKEEWPAN
jgi:hypothetical protein